MYSRIWLNSMSGKKRKADKTINLALSTIFFDFLKEEDNCRKLINKAKDYGFDKLELSVFTSKKMVEKLIREVNKGNIQITSVHSICPVPDRIPESRSIFSAYRISSDREEERKEAVNQILKTIRTARKLKAHAVILHAGEVEVKQSYFKLRDIFHREGCTENFLKKREKYIEQRDSRAKKYFSNTLRSIDEILKKKKSGVKLALETRSAYHEIPNRQEFKKLFDVFGNKIHCWYDVGHVALQSKMGFIRSPRNFLSDFDRYIAGMHIHDLKGLEDHLMPGDGGLDFSFLKEYFERDEIQKVLEIHPGVEKSKVNNVGNFFEIACTDKKGDKQYVRTF
ncbi:MAG: sugar phosphate isomerase/epimerase family protein [Elusimicrobiota bacterium]